MNLSEWTIAGHAWTYWLGWIWTLSSLVLTTWIVMQRRAPVSTLAWIITLNLLPVVGLAVYAYFGPQRVKRQRLKRWHKRAALMSQEDLKTLRKDRPEPPIWALQHAELIERSCGLQLASCQEVKLLPSGATTLDTLLQEISAAQKHIHLEYYIFEPDITGQAVLQALATKAREGVRVRLLVDAIGSSRLCSRSGNRFLADYLKAGGQFAIFHPRKLDRLRPLVNLRTHRKIAIIDGRAGLLGGINITDDENERVRPKEAYRDTHLLLRGGAVRWLQYLFLQDWGYAGGRQITDEDMLPDDKPGSVHVHIVASGPDNDSEAIHRAMIDAIHMARERIWLATPYFVPTESALMALTNAALRGVSVKLMVPEKSDSRVVTAAARSYFEELQNAGVLVFEYTGRMFHAKTLLIDQYYGMVGSANFDNRSFRLNFEVAAAVFGADFNQQLAAMFEQDLSDCKRVHPQRRAPAPQRLFEAVARLASPLL
ncbi:cardiolipin synthase [Ottowia thiooxydans]|uniref:cardiolipin synthase n=1 Tax=Ottowia thiooxydans TaxID=219182 RepID=UPI000415AD90|nr:cardiolipin synthase [Ottowia thiooxydans]